MRRRACAHHSDSERATRTAKNSFGKNRSQCGEFCGAIARCAQRLDVKGFAATALVLDVRIVEFEALVQAFACKVEFGAVDIRKAFRIDDDADAAALKMMVFLCSPIGELELVRNSRAPDRAHAHAHADALPALAK